MAFNFFEWPSCSIHPSIALHTGSIHRPACSYPWGRLLVAPPTVNPQLLKGLLVGSRTPRWAFGVIGKRSRIPPFCCQLSLPFHMRTSFQVPTSIIQHHFFLSENTFDSLSVLLQQAVFDDLLMSQTPQSNDRLTFPHLLNLCADGYLVQGHLGVSGSSNDIQWCFFARLFFCDLI